MLGNKSLPKLHLDSFATSGAARDALWCLLHTWERSAREHLATEGVDVGAIREAAAKLVTICDEVMGRE